MSRVKGKDLRGLSLDELGQKQTALERELLELRQKKITGQLDKPHAFKSVRRQVAQLNTIRREKQNADTSRQK